MSVSLWQRRDESTLECDIAIVGGGIAGLSAAIEATRRGASCIVLERVVPGAGASGRNAGFLMRGAADNYAMAARQWGRARARAVWRFNEQNISELRSMGVDRLGSYAARPSCLVALDEVEEAELRQSVVMLREDGFDVEAVEPGHITDTLWHRARPRFGLMNPHDAVINPVDLLGLLRSHLPDDVVRTVQEVYAIEPTSDGVLVRSANCTVRAAQALVCLNAFAPALLPELAGLVVPNRGQMLAMRTPPGARLDHAYYVNRGGEYLREAPGGLIIVGGARRHHELAERSLVDEPSRDVQTRIEQYARQWVADDFEIVARWAGIMGFSPDGQPLVGEVRPNVWFCGGFTGHGMSMAQKTARSAITWMLAGEVSLFDLGRLSAQPATH